MMNALDLLITLYFFLGVLKLLLELVCVIAICTLSGISIASNYLSFDTTLRVFYIGAIACGALSLMYLVKRWLLDNETILSEICRVIPIGWAVYGFVVRGDVTVSVLLLVLGLANVLKMRYPLNENQEWRV
jgi:hypothetical protein